MVEEQATLAELQKIADEVSDAFHRPTWIVAVVDSGIGASFGTYRRRITVNRRWLANPDLAKFRFELALSEALRARGLETATFLSFLAVTGIIVGFFVIVPPRLKDGSPMAFIAQVGLILLVTSGVKPFLQAYIRRTLKSEAFLRQLLEATHDPKTIRAYLTEKKAPPEAFAKFETMVATTVQPAQG